MPRIPEEEIERIKRQTDLVALARSRGVELNKHGSKDFAGKCPFHKEDTASFIVSPDKGLFHCMGCGVAGNVIQFVEKFDGVSFRHAFELLDRGGAAAFKPLPGPGKVRGAILSRIGCPFEVADEGSRLFDRRRRQPGGGAGHRAPDGARDRVLPRQVPLGHGCERVRPEGDAGGKVVADALERGGVARCFAFTHTRAGVFFFSCYSC
jgi:hypothetical protein